MSPDEFTLEEKHISVGNGHKLYTQLWGNKKGVPVVFLHGGPGSGCSDNHKTLFEPSYHKVIFIDQRGAGKSLPKGKLDHNITEELVKDITKVADAYGFKKFVVTGGSWGSCLALLYAIAYPNRVQSLVLRGIFTARRSEIDFLDKGGFAPFFPDVWEEYRNSTPEEFYDNPSEYHHPRMFGADKKAARLSAYAYEQLEGSLISLDDRTKKSTMDDFDPNGITIEVHYLRNSCFIEEGFIMGNAHKLTMPVYLVQGRYDMVCPPYTAYELSKLLPQGQLIWTVSGHSASDRANWEVTKTLLREQHV